MLHMYLRSLEHPPAICELLPSCNIQQPFWAPYYVQHVIFYFYLAILYFIFKRRHDWLSGILSIRYRDGKKLCRNQSGTGIRGPSPVPVSDSDIGCRTGDADAQRCSSAYSKNKNKVHTKTTTTKILYCYLGGWLWGLHYDQAGKCMALNLFRQILRLWTISKL